MSDDHSVQSDVANDPVLQDDAGPAHAAQSDSAGIDSDHSGNAYSGQRATGVQDEPVLDGALDDMSDGGTPKTEASDLMAQEGVTEVEVEQP